MASLGLKELAEFGIIRTLESEIKNHVKFSFKMLTFYQGSFFLKLFISKSNYGVIRNIITANGLWFPDIKKETSASFTVSKSHHLLTFATMLGPSPDWFSGN